MGHRLVVNQQLESDTRGHAGIHRAMQMKLGLLADPYTTMERLARMRGGS
jgi:hypothetical protein